MQRKPRLDRCYFAWTVMRLFQSVEYAGDLEDDTPLHPRATPVRYFTASSLSKERCLSIALHL